MERRTFSRTSFQNTMLSLKFVFSLLMFAIIGDAQELLLPRKVRFGYELIEVCFMLFSRVNQR